MCLYVPEPLFYLIHSAWAWGDPHITTLDGRTYTFNGWGEYVLLEHLTNSTIGFTLQGRTSPVNESISNSATQFSAFAFGVPEVVSFEVIKNQINAINTNFMHHFCIYMCIKK